MAAMRQLFRCLAVLPGGFFWPPATWRAGADEPIDYLESIKPNLYQAAACGLPHGRAKQGSGYGPRTSGLQEFAEKGRIVVRQSMPGQGQRSPAPRWKKLRRLSQPHAGPEGEPAEPVCNRAGPKARGSTREPRRHRTKHLSARTRANHWLVIFRPALAPRFIGGRRLSNAFWVRSTRFSFFFFFGSRSKSAASCVRPLPAPRGSTFLPAAACIWTLIGLLPTGTRIVATLFLPTHPPTALE